MIRIISTFLSLLSGMQEIYRSEFTFAPLFSPPRMRHSTPETHRLIKTYQSLITETNT